MALPTDSNSIKVLLPYLGFNWHVDEQVGKVNGVIFQVLYEGFLNSEDEQEKKHLTDVMIQYNLDDVNEPRVLVDYIRSIK